MKRWSRRSIDIRVFFVLSFFLYATSAMAQEQLGWHLQQNAGINSIALNPARMAVYPHRWDVNLGAYHAFFATNYAYIEQASMLRFAKEPLSEATFYARPDLGEGAKLSRGDYVVDFYDLRRKGYGIVRSEAMGPSFGFKINQRHSIGFFTRARMWAGTQDVPAGFSYYRYFRMPFFTEVEVTPFLINSLGWTEWGFNYALRLPVASGTVSLGISVKSLNGYEGGYIRSEKTFDLIKLPNDSIGGVDFIMSGALANANMRGEDFGLKSQGTGAGIDLGIQYSIEDQDGSYRWLFGLSVLDLGRIGFDGNSESHRIVGTQYTSLGGADYDDISGLNDLPAKVQLFSLQALGDPNASRTDDPFKMWLPTAVSLQVDHHFGNGWYAGGALLQGTPVGKNAPRRGSLLAVAPRMEKRWYAVSMPVSVYNWELMRVGLAARLAFLTLGTDDLGSWLIRKNFASTDFYAAIKVPFFRLSGNGGQTSRPGRRSGGGVDCYSF